MTIEKSLEIEADEAMAAQKLHAKRPIVYYRKNNRGPLIPAEPGSKEAGYARDPKNYNKLTKL